jgi:hypothetical protein
MPREYKAVLDQNEEERVIMRHVKRHVYEHQHILTYMIPRRNCHLKKTRESQRQDVYKNKQ